MSRVLIRKFLETDRGWCNCCIRAATDKNAQTSPIWVSSCIYWEFIDSGITNVAVDDYGGAFQVTEHLIKEHKFTDCI